MTVCTCNVLEVLNYLHSPSLSDVKRARFSDMKRWLRWLDYSVITLAIHWLKWSGRNYSYAMQWQNIWVCSHDRILAYWLSISNATASNWLWILVWNHFANEGSIKCKVAPSFVFLNRNRGSFDVFLWMPSIDSDWQQLTHQVIKCNLQSASRHLNHPYPHPHPPNYPQHPSHQFPISRATVNWFYK